MEKIDFLITIDAPRQHVWDTMLNIDTYEQWVSASWPDSSYQGSWKAGNEIRFAGPSGAGTLARVVDLKPYEHVLMEHIAALKNGGVPDKDSDMAKSWIGTKEEYTLTENQGKTTLTVHMEAPADWKPEFEAGWPKALEALKALAEKTTTSVHA